MKGGDAVYGDIDWKNDRLGGAVQTGEGGLLIADDFDEVDSFVSKVVVAKPEGDG